jgi:hypothetical protein
MENRHVLSSSSHLQGDISTAVVGMQGKDMYVSCDVWVGHKTPENLIAKRSFEIEVLV